MMLRIFRKKSEDPTNGATDPMIPSAEYQPKVVREALNKTAQKSPHIYQQVTGRELQTNIIEALSAEPHGRAQTALGVMGSLAGFSCLSAIYLKYERGEISPDQDGFRVEVTDTGRRIFFGNLVNQALFDGETSLWGMVSATSKKLGALDLPDINDISAHVERSCHTQAYGQPRLAEMHQPRDYPSNFVRYLMPSYLPLLQKYDANTDKFPMSFGFAIQGLLEDSCEDLDPATAAKVVMECAIPMATLDPAEVF